MDINLWLNNYYNPYFPIDFRVISDCSPKEFQSDEYVGILRASHVVIQPFQVIMGIGLNV